MSTMSGASSAAGNETSSASCSDVHSSVKYAIPYVEIRNTSILVPPGSSKRQRGKRIILPCYAAMESDFLANCLQGLSGLPGCESALLGVPWHAAHSDEPLPTTTTTGSSTGGVTPTQTDLVPGGTDTHSGGTAVTDLAHTDFFRPPPPLNTAAVVKSPSLASEQGGSGRNSSTTSPALVPRPPAGPPTPGSTSRTGLSVHGSGTNRPLEASSSSTAANSLAPLRGGIRAQWDRTPPTPASLLYSAFVRQNNLDTSIAHPTSEEMVRERDLKSAARLHVDVSTVTVQAMDDAEEAEARSGQTNILTAMFMPVPTPTCSRLGTGASPTELPADSAVTARLIKGEDEDENNSRSDASSVVKQSQLGERAEEGVAHTRGDGHRRGSTSAFTCFASNATPRLPSYEFPQLSDDVLVDVADFMVRRSTADLNERTTSTRLSLCDSLGDPAQFVDDENTPLQSMRSAVYQRGLELMMAASFLLL